MESLYDTILSSDDTVDVSGDDEAKGSLRILKSALSENLFYNLQSKNNAVSSEDKEQLRKYAERVSMLHQLNPNNYAETDDSRDPSDDLDTLTVEWFNENGKALTYLDDEAQTERENFLKKYGPELLRELEGLTLIRTVFLNDENKNNLCYELEFNSKNVELFGSIKSGTAYKYGLHFSKKNQKWATGTARTPKFISVDEAIELGTQIRDCLIAGAEIILNYKSIDSIDGYKKLYTELNEATDGYINRVWFLKYYQMIAPHLFPPIYSQNAQTTVLKAIGETPDINSVVRMGQLQLFINHCEISSVVFSRTFWSNYDRTVQDEDEITSEYKTQLKFKTGLECPYSRNRILFGAPGTGKSHNLNNETVDLVSSMNGEYERVTFHPDYSYANFVGTYKPVPTMDSEDKETITYKFVPGPFMRVLKNALKNANSSEESVRPFILVIEEINRANVAAVFGDVFQLLDRDDDNVSAYKIEASEDLKKYLAEELGGSPESYAELRIPDNMFIWATMNSADQGVFPMDTAFKRRWDFTYLGIDNGEENIAEKFVTLGKGSYERKVEWNKLRKAINNVLSSKEFKINEDKLMGPFFLSTKVIPLKGDIDEKKFVDAFKSKVIMYLFEDAAKQKKHTLFNGCKDTTRYSSIRDEFDEKGVFIFCNEVHNKFPAQSQDGETE